MDWLARSPDMNPIKHVQNCQQREELRPLIFIAGVITGRRMENNSSCGYLKVDSELPVELHRSNTGPRWT